MHYSDSIAAKHGQLRHLYTGLVISYMLELFTCCRKHSVWSLLYLITSC